MSRSIRNKFIYIFWELYSMGDWVFFSTLKCVGKCGGEWVKWENARDLIAVAIIQR